MLASRIAPARTVTVLSAGLEQAFSRCIALASSFGTIRLMGSGEEAVREFLLDPDSSGSGVLHWTLRSVEGGTELAIARRRSLSALAGLGRRTSEFNAELDRVLSLLARAVNMKIAVIGGGTGLYTTLLALRDRSWSLTAIISGLRRAVLARDPKDQLGSLPRDNESLCLVALSPSVDENVLLRSLLSHRMESRRSRGGHFGEALLAALEETTGSRQAALDAAAQLLGIRGRVALAMGRPPAAMGSDSDTVFESIAAADIVVLAPGHFEFDLIPVLCCPDVSLALRKTNAVKLVVTTIMTAEGPSEVATSSSQVKALAMLTGCRFDAVIANQGSPSRAQQARYASAGAVPIAADVEATHALTHEVVTERLSAAGDLARHDPERLGDCLIEVGARWLATRREEAS